MNKNQIKLVAFFTCLLLVVFPLLTLTSCNSSPVEKEGVLESFWAGVDFNNHKEEKQEIVNVIESYHNNVAAQMKRFGKW